jgi:2,3-bisphosphoglycerate-independent phosphoglycerate mutase
MVFVDGLGLGGSDPAVNPIASGCCPALAGLIAAHSVPLDAGLGVPGLPQSATGQTALLTGVNAAAKVGRHIEGFPGPELRAIIEEHNIFRRLLEAGRNATFANAYYVSDMDTVFKARMRSVTTIASLSAFGRVRDIQDMERNDAVYQDITRALLRERGYGGPLVAPADAAGHLLALARVHDFTLFEYFQTDRAGHKADMTAASAVLATLDGFLSVLIGTCAAEGIDLVLTSDHGNIEDTRTRTHTVNPVPLAAVGPDAERLKSKCRSLLDVTPAVLRILGV